VGADEEAGRRGGADDLAGMARQARRFDRASREVRARARRDARRAPSRRRADEGLFREAIAAGDLSPKLRRAATLFAAYPGDKIPEELAAPRDDADLVEVLRELGVVYPEVVPGKPGK
jgi:hypothetical protein